MKKKIVCMLIVLSILLVGGTSFVLYNNYEIKNVEKAIEEIGFVSVMSEKEIIFAEEMYEKLSKKQKEKVENYYTLKNARYSFDNIKYVYDGISALNVDDVLFVSNAQRIYNAYQKLSFSEKSQITNLSELEKYFCQESSCNNITTDKYCYNHKCRYCEKLRVHYLYWRDYCSEHLCKKSNCNNGTYFGGYCIMHD